MDALVWALTELSGDDEQEIILEYSEPVSISPELDRAMLGWSEWEVLRRWDLE
jgi:hypothetical protein